MDCPDLWWNELRNCFSCYQLWKIYILSSICWMKFTFKVISKLNGMTFYKRRNHNVMGLDLNETPLNKEEKSCWMMLFKVMHFSSPLYFFIWIVAVSTFIGSLFDNFHLHISHMLNFLSRFFFQIVKSKFWGRP